MESRWQYFPIPAAELGSLPLSLAGKVATVRVVRWRWCALLRANPTVVGGVRPANGPVPAPASAAEHGRGGGRIAKRQWLVGEGFGAIPGGLNL